MKTILLKAKKITLKSTAVLAIPLTTTANNGNK